MRLMSKIFVVSTARRLPFIPEVKASSRGDKLKEKTSMFDPIRPG